MDISKKEQSHRHKVEDEKIKIIKHSERRVTRMNWWGMFFAFLALVSLVALAAYALYLDKPWFAGIFGFKKYDFFKATEEEKETPKVEF